MPPFDAFRRLGARTFLGLPEPALRRLVGLPEESPEGLRLDPQSQGLLWLVRLLGESTEYSEVTSARRRHARSSVVLAPRPTRRVDAFDCEVPLAGGVRRARVYTPSGVPRPSPGLLWLHGGGFVLGSIETHDGVCRTLAEQAHTRVVSLDYRLAPEHRFPAGVDDAVGAARWLLEEGARFGVDPAAIAIGGDSAGGNLAAVAAQTLRADRRKPCLQVLVYPATDATCSQPSHASFAEGFLLSERTVQWFLDRYIADRSQVTDARVSPLLSPDLAGLPPALVVTAGFDPLRDEGNAYARRMSEAGNDVEHLVATGQLHGFLNIAGALAEPARLLEWIAGRLRRAMWARSLA